MSGRATTSGSGAWLTVDEVCQELSISRSTFNDWRAKRRAPKCLKLPNGELRIRRIDFDRWIEALKETT